MAVCSNLLRRIEVRHVYIDIQSIQKVWLLFHCISNVLRGAFVLILDWKNYDLKNGKAIENDQWEFCHELEGEGYENEMEGEWEALVKTLESISFEDMVSFYGMIEHGKKVPGDEEVREYWVKRFDPDNRIFRRKNCRKRKREE